MNDIKKYLIDTYIKPRLDNLLDIMNEINRTNNEQELQNVLLKYKEIFPAKKKDEKDILQT